MIGFQNVSCVHFLTMAYALKEMQEEELQAIQAIYMDDYVDHSQVSFLFTVSNITTERLLELLYIFKNP